MPYGPYQFQLRPPNRDYTADVRISGFESTNIDEWNPHGPQQQPLRPSRRDYTTLQQELIDAAEQSIAEWNQTDLHRILKRPPKRNYIADVRISGFEATNVDEWLPYDPTQIPPRRPQRDYTADTRISGFEATGPDEWQQIPWRQYRLRLSNRDNSSFLITLFQPDPTNIDEWKVYGPTQLPYRRPNRDYTSDTRISGFEATNIDEWHPSFGRQVRLRPTNPDLTVFMSEISDFEATNIDQWQQVPWRQYKLRLPLRDNTALLVTLALADPATVENWLPYEPTQFRLRRPGRDYTSDVRISGFEATGVDEWNPTNPTQLPLRAPRRDYTIFQLEIEASTQQVSEWSLYTARRVPQRPTGSAIFRKSAFIINIPSGSTVDRWLPYEPTQLPPRPPSRDFGHFVLVQVVEDPTTADQWTTYLGRTYRLRTVERSFTIDPVTFEFLEPPGTGIAIYRPIFRVRRR